MAWLRDDMINMIDDSGRGCCYDWNGESIYNCAERKGVDASICLVALSK